MRELGFDLLTGQVTVGAAQGGRQVLVGLLGVGQQALDAVGKPHGRVEDALLFAGAYDAKSGGGNATPVASLITRWCSRAVSRMACSRDLMAATSSAACSAARPTAASVGVGVEHQRGALCRLVRRVGGVAAEVEQPHGLGQCRRRGAGAVGTLDGDVEHRPDRCRIPAFDVGKRHRHRVGPAEGDISDAALR